MRITLKSILHDEQRYDTLGDWFHDEDGIQIRVDEMKDKDEEIAFAIHELVEYWFCKKSGITDTEVVGFDKNHPSLTEPGENEKSPYHDQHFAANKVEKMFREQLKKFK